MNFYLTYFKLFLILFLLYACESSPPALSPLPVHDSTKPSEDQALDSTMTSQQDLNLDTDLYRDMSVSINNDVSEDQSVFNDSSILDDLSLDQSEPPPPEFMPIPTPPPPIGYPQFRFPIANQDVTLILTNPVFGFDHDWSSGSRTQCEDHHGRPFPFCYDGHTGTDFMLSGGFNTMDEGSARVIAAQRGIVVDLDDGNYDRCHTDLIQMDISCDGYPMRPNYVSIRHPSGWTTLYYHLKSGSVQVEIGDQVECGTILGLIGSSGYSSSPHLHFEVHNELGQEIDPYTGPSSQEFSLWTQETQYLPGLDCGE